MSEKEDVSIEIASTRVAKFPIPMRGNESWMFQDRPTSSITFPIPMRGNEWHMTQDDPNPNLISDPHEG